MEQNGAKYSEYTLQSELWQRTKAPLHPEVNKPNTPNVHADVHLTRKLFQTEGFSRGSFFNSSCLTCPNRSNGTQDVVCMRLNFIQEKSALNSRAWKQRKSASKKSVMICLKVVDWTPGLQDSSIVSKGIWALKFEPQPCTEDRLSHTDVLHRRVVSELCFHLAYSPHHWSTQLACAPWPTAQS